MRFLFLLFLTGVCAFGQPAGTIFDPVFIKPAAAAGFSFTPSNEASVVYWMVADDHTGADNDSVDPWPARVGSNAIDHAWGTAPTLKHSIMNGHKVVRFNGTANSLESHQDITGTSNVTAFVCGIKRGMDNSGGFLTVHKVGGDDYDDVAEFTVFEGNGSNFVATYRNGLKSEAVNPGVGVPFVFTARFNLTQSLNYLGDFAGLGVASAGAFDSAKIGLAARWEGGGYSLHAHIDIAEVIICTNALTTAQRTNMLHYLNLRYAVANPKVAIVAGDSISQPGQWVETIELDWRAAATNRYTVNISVGGRTIDQLETDALTAIDPRATPTTVVFLWEYVNQYNAGSNDGQVQTKIQTFAQNRRAAGAKVIVASDFHDGTSSVNCQGAGDWVRSNWASFADGFVELDLQSLRDDSNNNSDGTHLTAVGNAIIAPLVKAAVEAVLP